MPSWRACEIRERMSYTMRKLLGSIGFAVLCWGLTSLAVGQPGMMAYWPLDEGAGTTARDYVGGYNGTLTNGPAWVAGKFGQALQFDGANDMVVLGAVPVASAAGSAALWFNTSYDWKSTDSIGLMFWASQTDGDGYGGQNEIHINVRADATNGGRMQFFTEGAGGDVNISSPNAYNDGLWHFVAATWDITGEAILYVDGAEVARAPYTTANNFVANGNVRLARPVGTGGNGRYFNGSLDDVRVFNRALTLAEVQALFSGTPSLPIGNARRTLSGASITAGQSAVVTLTALPGTGGQLVITENAPAAISTATATAGTVNVAGNQLTWTVTVGASNETLTYSVTPTAPGCRVPVIFSGTVNAGTGFDNLSISGDTTLSVESGWQNAPIQWGTSAWIADELPVGRAEYYSCDQSYVIYGAGHDIWDAADDFQFLYAYVRGAFIISANVRMNPPNTNGWAKGGLMVRANPTAGSPHVILAITNGGPADPPSNGNMDIAIQWRDTQGAGGAWGGDATGSVANNDTATLILARAAGSNDIAAGYDTLEAGGNVPFWQSHTAPNIDPTQVNLVGLAFTSHATGVMGSATFKNVALTATVIPSTINSVTRDIQAADYLPGVPIHVVLNIDQRSNSTLTVAETIPNGWTASNISNGGTQTGRVITWSGLAVNADMAISYDLTPADQVNTGLFSGTATDQGGLSYVITGEGQVIRGGRLKTVIYIYNPGSGQNPANAPGYDPSVMALLTDGLQVGNTFVGGLGYKILALNATAAAEGRNFTAADGDLIFISQTVGSGDVFNHRPDPLPMINTEQALNATDAAGQATRNEMGFGTGEGAYDITATTQFFGINNVDHPITAIFPKNQPLQVTTSVSDPAAVVQFGRMVAPFATGITVLANMPDTPADAVLAVAETGATGFIQTTPGQEPAPARRVCLGFHERSLTTPTLQGAHIFQRTIQWAMGDPVTAGTSAPETPTNFSALQLGSDRISLSWTDASTRENGFKIERKVGILPFIELDRLPADSNSYVDRNLTLGETYTYRVSAFNPGGTSVPTPEIAVTMVGGLGAHSWELYR